MPTKQKKMLISRKLKVTVRTKLHQSLKVHSESVELHFSDSIAEVDFGNEESVELHFSDSIAGVDFGNEEEVNSGSSACVELCTDSTYQVSHYTPTH